MKLYNGDCLIESDNIESGSVDLILTDLPYGTMGMEGANHGMSGKVGWDEALDTDKLMSIANRTLRKNGKMVLFAQDPFSNELKNKANKNTPHTYNMIWEKDHFANALNAKKSPLNYYEDVLIFSKKNCYEAKHPLKEIFFKIYQTHTKEECLNAMRTSGRFSSEQSIGFHTSIKFGYGKGMVFELMVEDLFNHIKKTMARQEI